MGRIEPLSIEKLNLQEVSSRSIKLESVHKPSTVQHTKSPVKN